VSQEKSWHITILTLGFISLSLSLSSPSPHFFPLLKTIGFGKICNKISVIYLTKGTEKPIYATKSHTHTNLTRSHHSISHTDQVPFSSFSSAGPSFQTQNAKNINKQHESNKQNKTSCHQHKQNKQKRILKKKKKKNPNNKLLTLINMQLVASWLCV
jgi:hypothetical protein